MSAHPEQHRQLTTSDRDLDELAAAIGSWLATKIEADRPPAITTIGRPETGGLSSSSVLFEAEWALDGRPHTGSYVARMRPENESFPVFHIYDLVSQYRVIEQVAIAGVVPVPELCWLQTDDRPLGTQFFVMRRVVGRVPADNPPYVFTGWLAEATPEQRARLGADTVEIIAKIHGITDVARKFPTLDGPGPALRRHLDAQHAWYRWALADDGFRVPVIERGLAWLEDHFPTDPGPEVLNWGDARPGNIIFDEFTPVAVLDWEMAALGPRELDLGWLIFIHRFFQDIAEMFDHPGLPDFLRREDVLTCYRDRTGHVPRDLDFYLVYAALRHAIVMARIKRRMIHFHEDTVPADPDDYVLHRASLDAMLSGTYEWT
ncbi:MAG TPA: phosphotransferase family protein [Pseudonocardiaceae bacterium]|nr:phosphotransferase family protein [Pseudonocardiaceae bacterium]